MWLTSFDVELLLASRISLGLRPGWLVGHICNSIPAALHYTTLIMKPNVIKIANKEEGEQFNIRHCNITRAERGSKDFYPRVWRENPEGAQPPRGFPDTRGGKIFATERERVMALLI